MELRFRLLQPHQVRLSLGKTRSFRLPQTLLLQEGDIHTMCCYIPDILIQVKFVSAADEELFRGEKVQESITEYNSPLLYICI